MWGWNKHFSSIDYEIFLSVYGMQLCIWLGKYSDIRTLEVILDITPLCSLLYTLLKDKYMCLQD